MGAENYIQILQDTLEKKATVLQALLEATKEQTSLAEAESFDYDAFAMLIERKESLLGQIEELDAGFEQTFEQVQTVIGTHKDLYRKEIKELQDAIRRCTDLGVEIQAGEERNKKRLESVFSVQQKEIRKVKTNSKVVSNYYKNVTNSAGMDPYFMDQKQ